MRSFFYSLFFPHSSNNHRAKILHHQSLTALVVILLFASFFFPSNFNPVSTHISAFADISLKELLVDTNKERQVHGLEPLQSNSELNEAAKKKAEDMFLKNYWSHNGPDGTTPWSFISGAGYEYVYAGENLARGFNSAQDVVNAWMASPDHRANILSPNYKDVGFSVQHGKLSGEETFLVIQEFGSKSVVPPTANILGPPLEKKVLGFEISPTIANVASLSTSSKVVLILLFVMLGTYLVDVVVMKKRQIPRVSGHSLDHSLFMAALVVIVVIFGIGRII